MRSSLVSELIERLRYEVDRARRLGPTLVRFGWSQLEDYVQGLRERRSSCDHVPTGSARRRRRPKSARRKSK